MESDIHQIEADKWKEAHHMKEAYDLQKYEIKGTWLEGEGLSDAKIEELRQQAEAQKAREAWIEQQKAEEQGPSLKDQEWADQLEKWKHAMKVWAESIPHKHGPFTWQLNANHNALRGCQSCGQTWVGVMAGTEDSVRWHSVAEPPEEEEE